MKFHTKHDSIVFWSGIIPHFQFGNLIVNTSYGAKFRIMKNTIYNKSIWLKVFVAAVWIPVCVCLKYLSIWINKEDMPAVW